MKVRERYLTSSTKTDRLYVKVWLPDTDPQVILQISHGMMEHIGRYEEFAEAMCRNGIGVVGNDHLGHGKTALSKAGNGYFAAKNGDRAVLADMVIVTKFIRHTWPQSRIVLFGHSMGSFFSRAYITRYDRFLSGVILCGTGQYGRAEACAGLFLSGLTRIVKGNFYRSRLLWQLTVGNFDRYFKEKDGTNWLSRDVKRVKEYEEDPMCGIRFTASAYFDLFSLFLFLTQKSNLKKIRKDLPILVIAGEKDPVGAFAAGPRKVCRDFKKAGLEDVCLEVYPDMRHELLNEIGREKVYTDLADWIGTHI